MRIDVPADAAPEEVAAIVAAVEVVWPRAAPTPELPSAPPAWRFSGRWWRVAPRHWPMATVSDRSRPV